VREYEVKWDNRAGAGIKKGGHGDVSQIDVEGPNIPGRVAQLGCVPESVDRRKPVPRDIRRGEARR